jgi:hypothetical protein
LGEKTEGIKMKVICTKCQAELKPENINIQKMVGHCIECNEIIQISEKLDLVKIKPSGSKIQEIKLDDGSLGLLFPKRRSIGIFFIFFGGFWDLISGTMLVATSHGKGGIDLFGSIFVSMFFLIGFVILIIGIALVNMKTALIINSLKIKLVRNVFGKEFIKEIANGRNISVNRVVRYTQNDNPVYGAKITDESSESITVGIDLSTDETSWLEFIIKSKI